MRLSVLPEILAICRIDQDAPIPPWALKGNFFSITKTNEELSIICQAGFVPEGIKNNSGWRCLKIEGPLNFSAVGILNSLIRPLTAEGISILAISTYATDYLLVKEEQLQRTLQILIREGHKIKS